MAIPITEPTAEMKEILLTCERDGYWTVRTGHLWTPEAFRAACTAGAIKRFVGDDVLEANVNNDPLNHQGPRQGDAILLRYEIVPMKTVTETQEFIVGWERGE